MRLRGRIGSLAGIGGGVLLCALSVLQTAEAASLHELAIGTTVSGSAEFGKIQLYLPPGDWMLLTAQKTREPPRFLANPVAGARVMLAQFEGGVLKRFIDATTNLEPTQDGWQRSRLCDRFAVHLNQSDRNYDPQNTQCWDLSLVSLPAPAQADFFRQVRSYDPPNIGLQNAYFLTRRQDFLTVIYTYNPEADGFDRPSAAQIANGAWQPGAVARDPRQATYVVTLKAEGARMLPLIKDGFAHKLTIPAVVGPEAGLPAPAPRKPLPAAPVKAEPVPISQVPAPEIAARLNELNALLGQSQISRENYETRRREILSEL